MLTTFSVRTMTTRTLLNAHSKTYSNTQTNSGPVMTATIPYIRGTSETIARILQPCNIRVPHKPITTLRLSRQRYSRGNNPPALLLSAFTACLPLSTALIFATGWFGCLLHSSSFVLLLCHSRWCVGNTYRPCSSILARSSGPCDMRRLCH